MSDGITRQNVKSVNGKKGVVTLSTADVDATADRNYVTDAQLEVIGNTSGTNTGDQDLSGLAPKASPAFSGSVGIGTDTPNSPLHIVMGGSATGFTPQVNNGLCLSNLVSAASNAFASLIAGISGYTGIYFGTNSAPTTAGVTHEAATGTLSFRSGNANRLNISTAGGFDINHWARFRQYFRMDSIADSAAVNSSVFASLTRGGRPCFKTSTGVVIDLAETCNVPGAYRTRTGLQRTRQALGQCKQSSDGTGFGGIDIPVIADSTGEGLGAITYLFDTWVHALRVLLQIKYNPNSVPGGLGLVPILTGMGSATSWPDVTFDCWMVSGSGWTKTDHVDGVGARMSQADVSDTAQARFAFDGTDSAAVYKRLGVTSLDLVYSKSTADAGTWRWDWSGTDDFIAVGTGDESGSAPDLTSATTVDGVRSTVVDSLDPSALNVIQVTGPATGTKKGLIQGCIAYNGDEDCGVRVHNLSNGGTQTSHYTSARNLVANIDAWGSATGGATNAKLFIFDFITNEAATGVSPATFKANYQTLISRALACPSKPSVLLIIPCLPGAGQPALANYANLIPVIYQLAEENEHVAVMDFNEFVGGGARAGRVTELGWAFDGLHYTTLGQQAWAQILFDVITAA